MGWQSFKNRFRGREAWRSINKTLYIGIYTLVIIGVLFIPLGILIWIFIGLGIVLPIYSTLFVNHLREMEKRDKGNKLVMGWLTHAFGSAEPVYFTPIKFERVEKMSPENLLAIKDYVLECEQLAKEAKVETGFDVFKPKDVLYKKFEEKEEMNKEEMRKLIQEETKELMKFKDDFKKLIKNRDENNNKEEPDEDNNLIENNNDEEDE